jgi:HAE1 family hydrophobic/amphiphilic exporter-1
LVTKNGILLVDYTNTLRSRGLGVKDALIEAGATRLRPIVMTTFTMVFGMIPLLIARGGASDMRRGIAAVVIGALISSTILTLALVPVVYSYVEGVKTRLQNRRKK